MDDTILVSIIIVSYNTQAITLQCIESIYKHLQDKITYEVICFDNNSSDNSVALIKSRFPSVNLVVHKENIGFGRANNQCFNIAAGKYFLLLNSDTYFRDDSLIGMIDFIGSDDKIGIVGGRMINSGGVNQITYGKFPTFVHNNFCVRKIKQFLWKNLPLTDSVEAGWVSGAYFLIKKEVLDKIGFFDERFWMYYEEIDLCRRVKSAGYTVYYYPKSTVIHLQGAVMSQNKKDARKKSRHLFYEKYYSKLFARILSLFEVR